MHRQAGDPVDIVITTDSTATAGDVARHIAASDPTRSIPVAEGDVLTLAVAPPTGDRLVPLQPDVPIGEAPIGSGFAASIVNYGPDYAVAGQREIVGVLRGHLGRPGRPGVPDCGGPRLPGSGGGQRRRPHRPHGLEASCAARSRHAHRGRRPELRERRTGGRCRGAARPGRGGRAVRDRRHHARAPPRALVRRLGDRGADHGARRRSAVQPQPSCGGALPGDPVQDPASAHGEDRQDVPLADPDRTDPGGDGAVRPERQSPFAPDHRDDAADGIRATSSTRRRRARRARTTRSSSSSGSTSSSKRTSSTASPRRSARATPRRRPSRRSSIMRCGSARCCGRDDRSTGTSSASDSAAAGCRRATASTTPRRPTASRTSSTVWTGSAIATRSSTTSRCSRPSWMPGRSASPVHKVRWPTRCAASLCSCSACTPRTTSSSWPSRIPPGRRSWTGSSGCRTPPATRARSATWRSRTPRRPAPRC